MEIKYVVLYFVAVAFYGGIGLWMVYYPLDHSRNLIKNLAFVSWLSFGILFGIYGPLRNGRIIYDNQILQARPLKAQRLERSSANGRLMRVAITNGKGICIPYTVDVLTRRITFSGVELPDDLEF
ncbi:MAG: hypothetical protein Q7R78_00870 [bacterium]|nr:hypothetical protein [bacterium]